MLDISFIAIMLVILGINAKEALEEFVQLSSTVLEVKGVNAKARTNLLKKYIEGIVERYQVDEKATLLDSNERSKGCKL